MWQWPTHTHTAHATLGYATPGHATHEDTNSYVAIFGRLQKSSLSDDDTELPPSCPPGAARRHQYIPSCCEEMLRPWQAGLGTQEAGFVAGGGGGEGCI